MSCHKQINALRRIQIELAFCALHLVRTDIFVLLNPSIGPEISNNAFRVSPLSLILSSGLRFIIFQNISSLLLYVGLYKFRHGCRHFSNTF